MQAGSAVGEVEKDAWRIKLPCQIQFLGPTQSGKSTKILELVEQSDRVFERPVHQFVYVAPGALKEDCTYVQKLYDIVNRAGKKLHVLDRLPTVVEVVETFPQGDRLLIVDDLTSLPNLDGLTELSGYYSHHANVSLVYSLQNPYQRTSKCDLTTTSRNLTGRFVFFQLADFRLYGILNSQIFPDRKNFIVKCLERAKEEKCNYIFINTHPQVRLERRKICYTALFRENSNDLPVFYDLGL